MYTCPYCKKEHSDYKVEKRLIGSKYQGASIRGRTVTHKFQDSYYYIRICPKCDRKKRIINAILNILIYIGGIILYGFYYFGNFENKGVGNFIGISIILLLPLSIIKAIIIKILDNTLYDIDYEEANRNGAILSIFEALNYKDK